MASANVVVNTVPPWKVISGPPPLLAAWTPFAHEFQAWAGLEVSLDLLHFVQLRPRLPGRTRKQA